MSNKYGSDNEWFFVFFCAFVGLMTLLIGAVWGLCWLANHVTILP